MLTPQQYPPIIQSFVIKGLYGDRDIEIEFDSSIKILVGENGTGKTTILNAFYWFLSGKIEKLVELSFEEIKLSFFQDQASITLPYTKLIDMLDLTDKIIKNFISEQINNKNLSITQKILNAQFKNWYKDREPIIISSSGDFRKDLLKRQEQKKERTSKNYKLHEIEKLISNINQNFGLQYLYLPTYRRIEVDLKSLGYDDEKKFETNEQLIQFGMKDVKERLYKITSEIKDSSVEWYSKISGQILEQLIDGINVDEEMLQKIENKEALKIVLDRIGKNISEDRKNNLIELIDNNKIRNDPNKYQSLVYFLSNLIQVYDQQKDKDNAIKSFSQVCNKYLINKAVNYDESKVEIKIISKITGKPVTFYKLSSGEKQILSLFSKLYLEDIEDCAIIFDEPELSLSVEWQRQLLPDILASKKCKFLLAATHSPFIFDNELDQFASGFTVKYRT